MEDTMLNLFKDKKYDEVITLLESMFSGLYIKMLKYKGIEKDYDNLDYIDLSNIVFLEFPQFFDNFSLLDAVRLDSKKSNMERINIMLSTYMFLNENYDKIDTDEEDEKEMF